MLATYALMTGRDPVDCKAIAVSDALLDFADWETERQILRNQEAPTMISSLEVEPRQPTSVEIFETVRTFWQHQSCSVCNTPDATCRHRAPAFAKFEALVRGLEPNAAADAE